MIYLERLALPSARAEDGVITSEKRTCFNTFYPFGIFPRRGLRELLFDGITMLYGGNGSGKSTLINLLAWKANAERYSDFNDAPLFDRYASMCYLEYMRIPERCCVLTSDDVFDYVLGARTVNGSNSERREALFQKYVETYNEAMANPGSAMTKLNGIDDYERWREVREIISPKRSQSEYIRRRVARDVDLASNGQTAMRYFLEKIDGDALYLLDEPENSLSIEYQIELAAFIEASVRATRSQFVIATHSPILLSMRNAKIYDLDADPASVSDWTELPNVRRYFEFFMDHRDEFQ